MSPRLAVIGSPCSQGELNSRTCAGKCSYTSLDRGQMNHSYHSTSSRGYLAGNMEPLDPPNEHALGVNHASQSTGASSNTTTTSTTTTSATPQAPMAPNAPAWSAHMSTFPANGNAGAGPSFPQFSASTAAILERLQQGSRGMLQHQLLLKQKRPKLCKTTLLAINCLLRHQRRLSAREGEEGKLGHL